MFIERLFCDSAVSDTTEASTAFIAGDCCNVWSRLLGWADFTISRQHNSTLNCQWTPSYNIAQFYFICEETECPASYDWRKTNGKGCFLKWQTCILWIWKLPVKGGDIYEVMREYDVPVQYVAHSIGLLRKYDNCNKESFCQRLVARKYYQKSDAGNP